MPGLLPPLPMFSAFVAASFILAVTPGPGVFYIVTRSATQGRAAGLASVAGVALGNFANATAASLGLAAVFALSSFAFVAVRYLGAAYLIYLGVRALRSGTRRARPGQIAQSSLALRRTFINGFVVALLNPKTTLFLRHSCRSFCPRPRPAEMVAMGALFVLIAATTDSCYALASGSVNAWLTRGGTAGDVGRYVSGGAYIGLGVLTVLTGQRTRT